MPRMKPPPWGPRMSFPKDPNNVLNTLAAVFLFLGESAVCLLRARGRGRWRGIPSALEFREGMEARQRALALDASRKNYEVLVPIFFLQTIPSQMSLIRLLAQPVGGSMFLYVVVEYLRG